MKIKVKREHTGVYGVYGLWIGGVRVGVVERCSVGGWWWATWWQGSCAGRVASKAYAVECAKRALRGEL